MALYPYSCCLLHMIVYQSVMYVKPFVKDKGNPPPNQGGFSSKSFHLPFSQMVFPTIFPSSIVSSSRQSFHFIKVVFAFKVSTSFSFPFYVSPSGFPIKVLSTRCVSNLRGRMTCPGQSHVNGLYVWYMSGSCRHRHQGHLRCLVNLMRWSRVWQPLNCWLHANKMPSSIIWEPTSIWLVLHQHLAGS